jgi:O-antigen/teichoic acid export membrane protein
MAGSLILTRILFPEAFGLMATVTTVLVMIQLFADTGVQLSIIQNPHGAEPEFLNTAWIISIGRGFILFGVIALAAWPVSVLYGDPALVPLFLVMAFNPLILGFENPAIVLLVKNFRVEKKFVLDVAIQLFGLVASIVLAYFLKSAIALAYGAIFSALVRVVGSYMVQPYSPRLAWNKEYGSELFNFGKFVFVNTIITWFALNADVLIVGKLLGMEPLGVYQIGRNIGNVVPLFFMSILAQAYMPAVSSVAGDFSRIVIMYNRTCAFILTLVTPAAMCVAFFSRDIIGLLYDPRYEGAYIALCWITISGIFTVLGSAASNTFFAMGRPKHQTMSTLVGAIVVIIIVPLGIRFMQMLGAVLGMLCVVVVITFVQSLFLANGLKFSMKATIRPWLQLIVTAALIGGVFLVLKSLIIPSGIQYFMLIALTIVIGFAVSFGVYFVMEGPNPFKDRRGTTTERGR